MNDEYKKEYSETNGRKKPYHTPVLEKYGAVTEFTLGATGPMMDGMAPGGKPMMMMMMMMP